MYLLNIYKIIEDNSDRFKSSLIILVVTNMLALSNVVRSDSSTHISIDNVKNKIEYRLGEGVWKRYQGENLNLPFEIRSADNSSALIKQGHTKITVNPNSELHIASDTSGVISRGAGLIAIIKQKIGAAIYKVEKNPGNFRVETPHLTSVVKGTRFTVSNDSKASYISVTEGLVEIRNASSGEIFMAKPGDVLSNIKVDSLGRKFQTIDQPTTGKTIRKSMTNPSSTSGNSNNTIADIPAGNKKINGSNREQAARGNNNGSRGIDNLANDGDLNVSINDGSQEIGRMNMGGNNNGNGTNGNGSGNNGNGSGTNGNGSGNNGNGSATNGNGGNSNVQGNNNN